MLVGRMKTVGSPGGFVPTTAVAEGGTLVGGTFVDGGCVAVAVAVAVGSRVNVADGSGVAGARDGVNDGAGVGGTAVGVGGGGCGVLLGIGVGVAVRVRVGRGVTVGPKMSGGSVGPTVGGMLVRSSEISATMSVTISVLMAGTGANCQAS